MNRLRNSKLRRKMKNVLLLIIILFTANIVAAQEISNTHKDSLNAIILKYYDLNLKIFQANSTVNDIDKVFDLFTENFTYIHPKYGGTYSRDDLYDGYVRNQKNGGYNGNVIDVEISNKIVGLNAAAVEKRYIEKNTSGTKKQLEMTLFEFKEGKISRIFEYW